MIFWLPIYNFIRYLPFAIRSCAQCACRCAFQVLQGISAWGRFITWRLIFLFVPRWIIFGYYWFFASMQPSKIKRSSSLRRTSPLHDFHIIHPCFMVLTNVIHPQGGAVRAYQGSLVHPHVMNMVHKYFRAHMEYIDPPIGFLVPILFGFHTYSWITYLLFRILWTWLVTKADELWHLFWPPPAVGTRVQIIGLQKQCHLNGIYGHIAVPYSSKTRRTGISLDGDTNIFVKSCNLMLLTPYVPSSTISRLFSDTTSMVQRGWNYIKALSLQHLLAIDSTTSLAAYSTLMVASMSASTLDQLRSFSYLSFTSGDTVTAILDNSATAHIFNDRSMFTSYSSLAADQSSVATIGEHTVSAEGIGSVPVTWTDDKGQLHTFILNDVLHFPKSSVNLISVTSFAMSFDAGFISQGGSPASITTSARQSCFTWDKYSRTILHPYSNLPELPLQSRSSFLTFKSNAFRCDEVCNCHHSQSYSYATTASLPSQLDTTVNAKTGTTASTKVSWADIVKRESSAPSDTTTTTDHSSSSRLSLLQQQFLRWHERCNHLPYAKMIRLSEQGILPKTFLKIKDDLPLCGSCLFGKQRRRGRKAKYGSSIRQPEHNYPGGGVSTDQIISAQPGLFPQSSGKLTNQRIKAVTVFIDHASDFSYVVLMTDCSGSETLRAKQEFESYAASVGVRISHYHADNGRFQESLFTDDLKLNAQTITFCGVNAHHQNGIVERHNGTLTESARVMLLHAQRFWPEAISSLLWPFALKYANHIHNYLSLNEEGKCPFERFSHTSALENLDISDFHTFGCPCYVLDSNEHVPKWNPRSSLRIFVGFSPNHARNVAMVLNPFTGLVSPQYHVVFDDHFQTLDSLRDTTVPTSWTTICQQNSTSNTDADSRIVPSTIAMESGGEDPVPSTQIDSIMGEQSSLSLGEKSTSPISKEFVDLSHTGLRRSERIRSKSYTTYFSPTRKTLLDSLHKRKTTVPIHYTMFFTAAAYKCEEVNLLFDDTINKISEFAFAANQQQNETYTFKDAMLQDDHVDFIKAMLKEIDDHESNNHWTMIERSSMPATAKTILSIWSFKRKRTPSGALLKHKARLCAHGGMQQWGENYWETYSPTVSWISIRALLAVSIIHDLTTSTIDFTLAFPQADLDVDVYMELPLGCVGPNGNRKSHVLKLNKSLYGLKQASHNWFNHLGKALTRLGYIQSKIDPCVWYKDGIVLLQYVDDLCIVGIDQATVASFKKNLNNCEEKFTFTDGGPLDNYLGVNVIKHQNGKLELNQPFLIDKIIETIVGSEAILHESNVPAVKELLHKDENGDERKHSFNYRQAIGMLTYLQGTTRPDISMAVHQCARFSSNPKRSHEKAVIKIVRYLKGTKDKGIILNPDKTKGIDCYVDASFASGWRPDDAHNASNLLSRTGYIIRYADCPVHYASKMQKEIALSTAEAEYIALSQAMRETIPFMRLMTELDVVFPLQLPKPKLHCKVFEDNEACISMAKSPRFTPRTKHLALKYHHFKSWISSGLIDIVHVESAEQIADILTKPLDHQLFSKLRFAICGW